MRNTEITIKDNLLNSDGSLKNPGWSRKMLQVYDRADIKAPVHRIKEWDYYLILNDDFAVCFTIADLAYVSMQSVTFLDFKNLTNTTKTNLTKPLVMGKLNLPPSSLEGDIIYSDAKSTMHLLKQGNKRKLICYFEDFADGKSFKCDIELDDNDTDSMVIATPFKDNKKAFYYNQKINCMPAKGNVFIGDKKYTFEKENSFGTLDWGRGVWTYDNTWFWGSGNGYVNKKPFGFNIGHGFGDTSAASENIIFYDGKAHKLDDVNIYYEDTDFMKPWIVTSSDKRFEMNFEPIINRCANIDAKIILSQQDQVFGKMTGTAILDDGQKIKINDLLCFIEKVHNKY